MSSEQDVSADVVSVAVERHPNCGQAGVSKVLTPSPFPRFPSGKSRCWKRRDASAFIKIPTVGEGDCLTADSWSFRSAERQRSTLLNSPTPWRSGGSHHRRHGTSRLPLGERAWRGTVIKVDDGSVYLNAGSNQGLQPGMTLTALSVGEPLIDPETGLDLGSESELAGTLQLTDVQDRFSIARAVEGCERLQAGDRVHAEP